LGLFEKIAVEGALKALDVSIALFILILVSYLMYRFFSREVKAKQKEIEKKDLANEELQTKYEALMREQIKIYSRMPELVNEKNQAVIEAMKGDSAATIKAITKELENTRLRIINDLKG
jgi:Na+-transporting methylmalonyl-CoA/oxaloacetate decarboxylase gamma subunit